MGMEAVVTQSLAGVCVVRAGLDHIVKKVSSQACSYAS